MFKSQIFQIFLDRDKENESFKIDKNKFEKEWEELVKCEDLLTSKFGDDEEMNELYRKLDMALWTYHYLETKEMFRKAFILGARVALEICGAETED